MNCLNRLNQAITPSDSFKFHEGFQMTSKTSPPKKL